MLQNSLATSPALSVASSFENREHTIPLLIYQFCSEVGLCRINGMQSHFDIAQVTHFPNQIGGIHDEDTKAIHIQSRMFHVELSWGRTQDLFPLRGIPLPIHLSQAEHLPLHESMEICAPLSLHGLIPEQVEIGERLIEASQWLLKRLSASAVCPRGRVVFQSYPFFRRKWSTVVVIRNEGHPPPGRRGGWGKVDLATHQNAPSPEWIQQGREWEHRRVLPSYGYVDSVRLELSAGTIVSFLCFCDQQRGQYHPDSLLLASGWCSAGDVMYEASLQAIPLVLAPVP